jgi:hypothetical protein
MISRLGLVVGLLISLPAAIDWPTTMPGHVSIGDNITSGRSARSKPFGRVELIFGTLDFAKGTIHDRANGYISDYFGMYIVGFPEYEVPTIFEPDLTKATDVPQTILLVGCEPLGGATSKIDQIPGTCLS